VNRCLEQLTHFFRRHGFAVPALTAGAPLFTLSVHAAPAGLAASVTSASVAAHSAASTSILTLKGALKVMAWSKTKATIAGAAIALLGIGTTVVVVSALLPPPVPPPDIQGTWEGPLDLNARGLGVHWWESPQSLMVMRIAKTNGDYQASFDITGLGVKDVESDKFTYKYPDVHAEFAGEAAFDGKVNRFGGKITWKAVQTNQTYSMVLRRTTHPTPFPEPLTYPEFAPRAGSVLQGYWVGQIPLLGMSPPFEVRIAEATDGTFRADAYVSGLTERGYRFPTTVSYDGTTVKLMPMVGFGMFEGQLRNGSREMTGDWIQDGQRTPETLTQADYTREPAYTNSWLTPNLSSGMIDQSFPQVRIIPTRFPTNGCLLANNEFTKWAGINQPVSMMIWAAYQWLPARMVFSDPAPPGRYDFIASLPQGSHEALQRELQKQFGLVGRAETRDENVLVLKVRTPNTPGLKSPVIGGQADWGGNGQYVCDDCPLSTAAPPFRGLQVCLEVYFKVPVVDETGLTNHFSIDLKWNERGQRDPNHEALKEALLDQLGLELVPARRSIRMLVVEPGEFFSPAAEGGAPE
jgi:uncharacterized protein (TIGR03435 family)